YSGVACVQTCCLPICSERLENSLNCLLSLLSPLSHTHTHTPTHTSPVSHCSFLAYLSGLMTRADKSALLVTLRTPQCMCGAAVCVCVCVRVCVCVCVCVCMRV